MKRLLLPLLLAGLFAHCSTPTDSTTLSEAARQVSYDSGDVVVSCNKWNAKSAETECYEMTVEEVGFGRTYPLRIRVEHGAIVEVAQLLPSPNPPSLAPPSIFDRYPTIDTLFNLAGSLGQLVKDSTAAMPVRFYIVGIDARYDVTWGFPSKVVRQIGLDADAVIGDLYNGYKVTAFKPLDCP